MGLFYLLTREIWVNATKETEYRYLGFLINRRIRSFMRAGSCSRRRLEILDHFGGKKNNNESNKVEIVRRNIESQFNVSDGEGI